MILEWFVKTLGDVMVNVAGAILPPVGGTVVDLPPLVVYGYDWLNRLLPLTEALALTAVILAAYGIATIWHGVLFVYHQIWGSS